MQLGLNSTGQFKGEYHNTLKPLPANGELVKNGFLTIPRNIINDISSEAKALKKGIKGEANDYELGKLNNLGMKSGALAMTLYLMGKEKGVTNKIKPLIGVLAFFASMDIWPKIALQLPAKLVHGINIMQEYKDNYGKIKPFYQDTQFLPWDLYTDKQIDEFGDKLKIKKDIKNRREFIQEKMRKIALQNNTMWMITAGFATPIIASLISHKLQPLVANRYISNIKGKLLGKNAQMFRDNHPQVLTEFVNNYAIKMKNDLLKILNIKYKDSKLIKDTTEETTSLLIQKLKSKNIEPELISNLNEIIKIENVIKDEVQRKTISDLKMDYIKLLHISRNKDNIPEEALYELISSPSNIYKQLFSPGKEYYKYNNIFAPDNQTKNITNDSIRKEYENYKLDIMNSLKDFDTQAQPIQATDGLINQVSKESYNNTTWFNRVGLFGLGLYITTVMSQFLFGKMEEKQQ